MKTRALVVVVAALFIALGACAQADALYTSDDDLYVHACAACDFRDDLRAATADEVAEKDPCYICVRDDTDYGGVAGVYVGDVVLLRVPDAWMASKEDTVGIFADTSPDPISESLAYTAGRYLRDEAYAEFMRRLNDGEDAEIPVSRPDIYPKNHEYMLSCRHIGAAWYVAFRCPRTFTQKDGWLGVDPADGWTGYLRFSRGNMVIRDGVPFTHIFDEWNDTNYRVETEDIGDGLVLAREGDGYSLSLYRRGGIDLVKIVRRGHASVLAEVFYSKGYETPYTLFIDGRAVAQERGILPRGDDAEYWCALTHAEAERVLAGADAHVVDGYCREEDFSDAGWAPLSSAFPGYWPSNAGGVVDREGHVRYRGVWTAALAGDSLFLSAMDWERHPAQGFDGNGMLVLDRETLAEKAFFPGEHAWLMESNDAVYTVELRGEGAAYICDAGTDAVLRAYRVEDRDGDMPVTDAEYPEWIIHAGYPRQAGRPGRLVFGNGSACWLADNAGNRVTEDFEALDPVLWWHDNGLFCVQSGTDHVAEFRKELYEHGYSGQELHYLWHSDGVEVEYDPDWRCGVIDKDGNVLAACEYKKIRIVSDSAVELTREDGTTVTVDLDAEG